MNTSSSTCRSHAHRIVYLYWPNNGMQTVFHFTNIQLNGSATTYGPDESVGNPVNLPDWAEDGDPYSTPNNRGGITPSPQFQIGDEESRVLGAQFRMRINKAPPQTLTVRYRVIDSAIRFEDVYNAVAFSGFATTVHVNNARWINIRPEFRNQPQQKIFHHVEQTPGDATTTYFPIAIVFMNVRSPTSDYVGDMVLELEAEHTIEHRLPDGLKHLHNNSEAKTLGGGVG